jgi:hypothetical protein
MQSCHWWQLWAFVVLLSGSSTRRDQNYQYVARVVYSLVWRIGWYILLINVYVSQQNLTILIKVSKNLCCLLRDLCVVALFTCVACNLQGNKFVEDRRKKLQTFIRKVLNWILQKYPDVAGGVTKEKLIEIIPLLGWVLPGLCSCLLQCLTLGDDILNFD